MIVQACLNGARPADYHPRLPIRISDLVEDAVACVRAGASELHVHVHDETGKESLDPIAVAATIRALRNKLPGTLIGISTGDWIEADDDRRLALIASWDVLPDHASVNLNEAGADRVIELLLRKGTAVEAGLASVADAMLLIELGFLQHVLRVLVEMNSEHFDQAASEATAIVSLFAAQPSQKPILLHGFDDTVWPFVRLAAEHVVSTRVGLEDGCQLPDGSVAGSNTDLVAAAVRIMRA